MILGDEKEGIVAETVAAAIVARDSAVAAALGHGLDFAAGIGQSGVSAFGLSSESISNGSRG